MDISIIDSIKSYEDKDEVIRIFEEGIEANMYEFNLMIDCMKKLDKGFVVDIRELQLKTINEDLILLSNYLKNKYSTHSILKDEAAMELFRLLEKFPPEKL